MQTVLEIRSTRTTDDGNVTITLAAHTTVQPQAGVREITISTAPRTFTPEADDPENEIEVEEDEELWDLKFVLRQLGFDEDNIESAAFIRS